jgi:catechol 2,3-dioxygenase-like lactoylglutathione lyase family enzyme
MHLDHVALAMRDVREPLGLLVARLGGTVISGGEWVGFRPMQVFLGDEAGGMKVELLEPWAVERNDFLDRFLARHGDGPHHLTFKVDDLEGTLAEATAAGFTPVSVDLSQPEWREAFLLPSQAHGTVVQLADSNLSTGLPLDELAAARRHGPMASPRWWPDPPAPAATHARLRRIVLRSRSLGGARMLFVDLLGGTPVGTGPGEESLELEWPGGARLRIEPGDEPGVDRLELEGPADDLTVAGARFVVRPPPA